MGAVAEFNGIDTGEFFAPSCADMIDGLIGQYRDMRAKIEQVVGLFDGDLGNVVYYFVEGNKDRGGYSSISAERIFQREGAIAKLNADFWSQTLAHTDVLNCMPQKRRDEWNKTIAEMTTPEFEETTVRATIEDLLGSRAKFLAERVDGIFRNLSGEHVTNSPMGFGKRMIIGYMLSYSSVAHERAGLINDLRAVIAKFMGRDEPQYYASSRMLDTLRSRWGEWVTIDGGALRIRLYKKGTAHLEVHPDMAWRLNSILANLYPMAIPSEFRTKPKKRVKTFSMIGRPLPFAVIEILAYAKPRHGVRTIQLAHHLKEGNSSAWDEAGRVLVLIGGAQSGNGSYEFEYDPGAALDEIITSGCIPDQQAHQFYPTPESIATVALEMAAIGPDDSCLEPSAGTGGLADLMPKDRTTCIEISGLHCKVLESKGFKTVKADFLLLADDAWNRGDKFDAIVMNPPFANGRARAHVDAAAGLVCKGGRLVAILPASMREKVSLPGFAITWSRVFDNEFAATSVSVAIMKAEAV